MGRVWIEDGCIQCFWCQNLNPTVFAVGENGCQIRADARVDGETSDNRAARAELKPGAISAEDEAFLPFLAGGCPSQVIRLEGFAAIDDPLHLQSP
jgi:ferredoxin